MYLAIDIDDTLCYTTLRRMKLFQERFGNPESLTPQEMVETYEIVQRVPYRQTPEAQDLVETLITDDDNRMNLQPIPGGREALIYLEKLFPLIYLTSRQEEHREKTITRFQNNNFPNYELIMRPHETNEAVDAHGQFTWKARYLLTNYPNIGGIIDNSLSLAKQLDHLRYPGKHILFGHTPERESPTPYHLQSWENIKSNSFELP